MSDEAGDPHATESSRIPELLEKQKVRAAVLRCHYDLNEESPGTYGHAREISEKLGVDIRLIVGAGLYFIDKKFLDPGKGGVVEEIGNRGIPDYYARITDMGIDFVEDPTGWHGREVPGSLVYILLAAM